MTTADNHQNPDTEDQELHEQDHEPASPGLDRMFQQFDTIAASSGGGHDRRPDLVFLERIRTAKERTQNTGNPEVPASD